MARVKFISTDYFKQNTTVDYNIDDDKITAQIYKAQDIYLQQTLGTLFLDRLYDGVANNDLNTNEENLIRTYIQPMLSEYTLYLLIPSLNYNFTNKSVQLNSGDNDQPSSLDEIKYLRNEVKDMAEFYDQRLTKYLCDNDELFPEYENSSDNNLNPKRNAYFSGIYLGNNKCDDDCTWENLNQKDKN